MGLNRNFAGQLKIINQMPFLTEINPAPGIRAGIWHITESAEELTRMISLSEEEQNRFSTFSHEGRKRHWLACRALLTDMLVPAKPHITYDLNGKPWLIGGGAHISLSHAGDYAAIVWSVQGVAGIDIEEMKGRIERVKERFLSEDELETLVPEHRLKQLYIYWGAKEALFKLYGTPGLDFKKEIHIHPIDYLCHTNCKGKATITCGNDQSHYQLFYQVMGDYMVVISHE